MTAPVKPAYWLYQWLWTGIDWLYPPRCAGCDQPGAHWCSDCQRVTQRISPPICLRCGQPNRNGDVCPGCRRSPPSFEALRSWAAFQGPVRNAIHRLKYHKNIALGWWLAEALGEIFALSGWKVDLVTPVPLGLARLRERGYNQAALLAHPLALRCGLHYEPRAVIRTRETLSQVNLSVSERKLNVADAFRGDHRIVGGKVVLVVDDVATSGATLNACAEALLEAGCRQVYCLTLARAL